MRYSCTRPCYLENVSLESPEEMRGQEIVELHHLLLFRYVFKLILKVLQRTNECVQSGRGRGWGDGCLRLTPKQYIMIANFDSSWDLTTLSKI